jgi:hypothetical protein
MERARRFTLITTRASSLVFGLDDLNDAKHWLPKTKRNLVHDALPRAARRRGELVHEDPL